MYKRQFIFSILWYRKLERHNPLVASSSTPPQECAHKRECKYNNIARCILKDAPIVILDEATASVDADNESYIQQAISELCKGKTLLVIAHRLNTIRNANQILVIADGRIAQSGTHKELMEAGGLYRDFVTVRQQSQGWNLSLIHI